MDHLQSLLQQAVQSETPVGQQRVEEITQQVRDLDGVDLAQLATDSAHRFEELYGAGEYDPDHTGQLEALADITDALRLVNTEQQQAVADRDQHVSALADRVRADTTTDTSGDQDDTGDGTPAEPPPAPEPPAEVSDEPRQDNNPTEQTEQADAVAASAGRPNTAAAVRDSQTSSDPAPTPHKPLRSLSLTAAADVPDQPHGKRLAMREAGAALVASIRDMPPQGVDVPAGRKGIVNLHRHFDESLVANSGNQEQVEELLERITDETRLPGGSLTAAARQQHDQALTAGPTLPTPPGDIWCSPSVQDYSFCPALASATEGILDTPTFAITGGRGGLRFTTWPQYPEQHRPLEHREVPNGQGWQDNDQDQAWPLDSEGTSDEHPAAPPRHDWHGYVHHYDPDLTDPDHFLSHPKKYIEGPCPEWREERMHLAYLWVRADRLRQHTYPEAGQRFLSDVLVSHRRFMNETYIRWIYQHSDRIPDFDASTPSRFGPAGTIPPGPSSPPGPSYPRHTAPAAWYETTNEWWPGGPKDISSLATFAMGSASEALIERLGLLVTWFRDAYRTTFSHSLEGFAPYWLRNLIKIDLERKSNRPHNLPVSDAEVDAIFSQWGVRMQWVYDFQSMPSTETQVRDANGALLPPSQQRVMPPGGWPNACDLVLYPAGAWALAQDQILRISGEQALDTRELRTQKFTRLFMEDSWLLLNKCQRSFKVRLTNLCANGAVGARRDSCLASGTTITEVTTSGPGTVTVGSTIDLTASAKTSDGFGKDVTADVTWSSSDETVATVSGGTVTGVKAGTAQVTATYQNVTSANHAVQVTTAAATTKAAKS